MNGTPFTKTTSVAVTGGELHVATAGDPQGAPVLLVHGISSSHRSWTAVARELLARQPNIRLIAPDLRGRGRSDSIDGPFGVAHDVADMTAVLEALDIEAAVLAGHSLGAWILARLAAEQPQCAHAVVLVDGGISGPLRPEARADPDQVLADVLGPAVARLRMTFATPDDYVDFWRSHPAFADGRFTADVEDWALYDLEGEPPQLRSRAREDAVRADGADLVLDAATRTAIHHVKAPVHLLRAELGLLHDDRPFLARDLVEAFAEGRHDTSLTHLRGSNHYTITLGAGSVEVAQAIAQLCS